MDSGSLTDLAFLLIIYFIVIAGFNVNKGFLLNLPEKDKPRVVQSEDLMRLTLQADGSLLIHNETLSLAEVETEVQRQREEYPETTLLLLIEPDTPYQKMVNVIHMIRRLKVENFSFKMAEDPGAGGSS